MRCLCRLQVKTGVPAEQALMVLVPEAYRNHPDLVKNYPEVSMDTYPIQRDKQFCLIQH